MRVLVVDDAAVSRAAFARIARAAGFDVVGEAAGVAEGLALAAALRPDAVIVDGRLVPDLSSAFVAPLRERDPSVGLYIVAALDETALVRAAVDAGATGALLRPILASQLSRILAPRASAPEDASRPDSAK
jgi:two-component system nitrate/nitrite response regulator NarL